MCYIMSTCYYHIDQSKPRNGCIFHGWTSNSSDRKVVTSRPVSFITCGSIAEASQLRKRMDILQELAIESVVKAYSVATIQVPAVKGSKEVAAIMGARSLISNGLVDKHCVITEQVPALNFREWLKNANQTDQTFFFRLLFSAVWKFHEKGKYFGNIEAGVRISDNCPKLVLPKVVKGTECDMGIREDNRELHNMVLKSKMTGSLEWKSFDKLCKQITQDAKYNHDELRLGSFLVTHSPIVFTSTDRYNLNQKLWEYSKYAPDKYDDLSRDAETIAVPIKDWSTRIVGAEPSSLAFKLTPIYNYPKNNPYTTPGSIVMLQRNAYEHKEDVGCSSILEMEELLYSVFPEVPASLYEMLIDWLLNKGGDSSIIKFLQVGPHKFDF